MVASWSLTPDDSLRNGIFKFPLSILGTAPARVGTSQDGSVGAAPIHAPATAGARSTTRTAIEGTDGEGLEGRLDGLAGLAEHTDQFAGHLGIVSGEKGEGRSSSVGAPRATDSMDIVFNVAGHVVIDDKFDVLDI